MKVISQREFRNHSAAVMDAVEAGETYHVTRNGVEVAELRPLPQVDHSRMRQEADEFFGDEDRAGDFDPWERSRG
ncbi:type II toxin-antitoxin system Phd/YefM family antitoxin [Lentzea sp. NPDC060358]|uniref:type II toxin-antitoxin system Phd/YefM family antitoxin n=1 Tax=Lentzea sp. NPDC060358 TaxID=3347103 RepID=UPI00364EAAC4